MWHVGVCAQLNLTHCDPIDCSPPGSPVHGILQARTLEWVAVSSSRGGDGASGLDERGALMMELPATPERGRQKSPSTGCSKERPHEDPVSGQPRTRQERSLQQEPSLGRLGSTL